MNNTEISSWNAAENFRRTDLSCRIGTIVAARYDVTGYPGFEKPNWTNEDQNGNFRWPLYRVQMSDDQKIYWMPALALRASNDQSYWAYEVGEQVAVLCPSGDPMRSIIIGAFYQDAHRPPIGWDDETVDKRPWRASVRRDRFADETLFEYDRKKHRFLGIFLNASNSYFEYNHGEFDDIRKLTIHCKDIWTLTDHNTEINADNDIKLYAKRDIWITADRNLEIRVGNDENTEIGNDQTLLVGRDQTSEIGNDQTLSVGHDQITDIGNDQRTVVGNDYSLEISNNQNTQVGNDQNLHVGQNINQNAGNDISQTAGNDISQTAGNDISQTAGNDINLSSSSSIVLTAPSIELNAADVVINGNLIVNGNIQGQNIQGQNISGLTIFATIASDNLHVHPGG